METLDVFDTVVISIFMQSYARIFTKHVLSYHTHTQPNGIVKQMDNGYTKRQSVMAISTIKKFTSSHSGINRLRFTIIRVRNKFKKNLQYFII